MPKKKSKKIIFFDFRLILLDRITYFVLYLKIFNTFWKTICASYNKLSKELINSTRI